MISPTACGNILAAAADRLDCQLGLNLTHVWQPLVANLPEDAVTRLITQSSAVLMRCQQLLISGVALSLGALLPWRFAGAWLGSGAIAFLLCRRGLISETMKFAEQVHTTVVVHRSALYASLGMKPPTKAQQEVASGRTLTQLLQAYQDLAGAPPIAYHW